MGLNVYEDLGFSDAEAMFIKAGIMVQIQRALRERRLSKARAAKLLGIESARLADYFDGHFHEVTAEELIRFLNLLGQNVELVVTPKPADQAYGSVTVRNGREQAAA